MRLWCSQKKNLYLPQHMNKTIKITVLAKKYAPNLVVSLNLLEREREREREIIPYLKFLEKIGNSVDPFLAHNFSFVIIKKNYVHVF